MIDNLQLFKEQLINNYISSIDLTDINVSKIKEDLKNILGEEPAIKLNYVKQEMILEDTGEKIYVEKIESITIVYTVEKTISEGVVLPFPVSKKIIID